MIVALLVCAGAGAANGEGWRRLMTEGKLEADLGNHDRASAAFRAVADDEAAPGSLRWEALVRFGLARSAAGDPGAGAEAFRTVLANYAGEPEAMRFLTSAVAMSVPGKIWIDFREEFEELLRTAHVVSAHELGPGGGARKVELREGDVELSAVWRNVSDAESKDSYIHEVAAYEVDKILGLDMVPPTVERAIEGQEGTLQLFVLGCEALAHVRDRVPDTPEWRNQLSRAKAFDYLIGNVERREGNTLVYATWEIVLVDHTRGFSVREKVPDLPDRFDRQMVQKLRRLSRPILLTRLKDILSKAEVEGLLKRRDALLAHVEKLVADKGEPAVLF
ncbi:MAG: hypothetical protein PVJ73_16150 [Acidobacteriota bacterium]|jgi:hypothetical protein